MRETILNWYERQFWKKMADTHDVAVCEGRICIVHKPLEGPWRELTMWWRADRQMVERICGHGVGHPDPSQFAYWRAMGEEYQCIHGCDGCCADWAKYASFTAKVEEIHQ